jgi:hypothetical protein
MNARILVCGNVFDGISDALTCPAEALVRQSGRTGLHAVGQVRMRKGLPSWRPTRAEIGDTRFKSGTRYKAPR